MHSFLWVIDYYFNTKLENSSFIKHLQNAHTLAVALGCGVGLYCYETYSSDIIPHLQKAILAQCTLDLFLTSKPDIFIHHMITISMVMFSLVHPFSSESLQYKYAVIISSELSSIFLVINYYIEHHTVLSAFNSGVFISSFFYTRLVLFSREMLFDETFVAYTLSSRNPDLIWYSLNIYSFLCINVYWGSILVNTVYKKLRRMVKSHHTNKNTENLLRYTLFLSPVVSASLYLSSTTSYYMVMDLTGLVAVSASSYSYHNALFKLLGTTKEKINVLRDTVYPFYLSDITTIHIRSFLVVCTSFLQLEDFGLKCILIVNNALFHIVTLYIFYDHHRIKKAGKQTIVYDESESLVSTLVKVPLLLDTIIVAYNCTDVISRNHIVLSTIMIFFTMVVKPFYEMNHFFFHLLLIYQSFAATLGIVSQG
jgi:hypothetical protein